MDTQSKLNMVAKQVTEPKKPSSTWEVGKKKDLEDFSKGANQAGTLDWSNFKKAFGAK